MGILFRSASANDAHGVLDIYAPFVRETPVSFEVDVPSLAEMNRRIATSQATHAWLVAEEDGLVVGYAYASTHRAREAYQWAAEVSVYVHPGYQRRGLGKALYTSLFALLGQMGYRQALAGISLPNDGSVGLHSSLGFTSIGIYQEIGFKQGVWWDTLWMQKPLGAAPGPGKELVKPEALGKEVWDSALRLGMTLLEGTSKNP
jgi:L-amino acid N-acyltransferase YncA